jgi:hypothetical protein
MPTEKILKNPKKAEKHLPTIGSYPKILLHILTK